MNDNSNAFQWRNFVIQCSWVLIPIRESHKVIITPSSLVSLKIHSLEGVQGNSWFSTAEPLSSTEFMSDRSRTEFQISCRYSSSSRAGKWRRKAWQSVWRIPMSLLMLLTSSPSTIVIRSRLSQRFSDSYVNRSLSVYSKKLFSCSSSRTSWWNIINAVQWETGL